eukprot:935886-Pleurochrysis_carterae.AAC.1
MRGEHAQCEKEVRAPRMESEKVHKGEALGQSRGSPPKGKAKSQSRRTNLAKVLQSRRFETGTGVGERKRRSSTAPAA